jgi:hypothetical protein
MLTNCPDCRRELKRVRRWPCSWRVMEKRKKLLPPEIPPETTLR